MGNVMHSSSHEVVLSRINEFRKTGNFCDVKLVVEGVEFPAHRNVLAGFSPYFGSMFSGNFAESKEESVKLESLELGIMESLLEYAYTGKMEITCGNVQALLHAANFLQIEDLFNACCKYLEANVNTRSCVAIYNISEVYACKKLREKAREIILLNFSDVCAEVDFLELEAEKLIDLIEDSGLHVGKEEHVFDAVLQWIHYKQEEREPVLPEVISHVRLANVDPYFLHTRLKTTDVLMKSDACTKLFLDVFSYQSLPNRRSEIQPSFAKERVSAPFVEVLIVTLRDSLTDKKHNLCVTEEGGCAGIFHFPSSCNMSTLGTTSGNELFFVDFEGDIIIYDYKSDKWIMITMCDPEIIAPSVPEGKAVHNFDGRWYTFSLVESDSAIECLVDESGVSDGEAEWRTIPPMPVQVYNPGVVCLDGMLYVVGGKAMDKTPSMRLQRYDPFNKSWSIISQLTAPWKSLKACALNGNIYVYNSPDDSEYEKWEMNVYEVSSGQWKALPKLPEKFRNHILIKTVAFRGKIFVLVEKDNHFDIQVFSPHEDSWSNFPLKLTMNSELPELSELCTFRGPTLFARSQARLQ